MAEANENMDLVLDAQALLQPVLELLLPANYAMALMNDQNSSSRSSENNNSSSNGDVLKEEIELKASGEPTISKSEPSEDVVREFAEKLQNKVQDVLREFRRSNSPIFLEIFLSF